MNLVNSATSRARTRRTAQKFYPAYRGLATSLAELGRMQGSMAFAVIPMMIMLSSFLDSFVTAEANPKQ